MRTKFLGLLALGALLALTAGCHREKTLEGDWQGSLSIPAQPQINMPASSLKIIAHIKKDADGKMTGTLDSPDQKSSGINIDSVTLNDSDAHLGVSQIGGAFDGKLNDAGDEIAGNWKQGPATLPLTLKKSGGDTK